MAQPTDFDEGHREGYKAGFTGAFLFIWHMFVKSTIIEFAEFMQDEATMRGNNNG